MNRTGPTPGPWEVAEPFASSGEYVRLIGGIDGDADDDGRPIPIYTHVCDVIDNQDERANARLIAAAPDLLAACKEVLAHPKFPACDCGEEDCATSRLRAAIDRAEAAS